MTEQAIRALDITLPDKKVNSFLSEFGDNSINFTLMFWIHYSAEPDYLKAKSDAIIAIKKAFDENGITIPFPIRTLDFGIKGGKTISDMSLSLKNGKQLA